MSLYIEESWDAALQEEYSKPYFEALQTFIHHERLSGKEVYPPHELVFNALVKTPLPAVKVVIVGQDPYHGRGQAHGLSFSVPKGVTPPPSLKNIFKELINDVGINAPSHGSLESWSQQGVLLLNAILTVEDGSPLIHQKRGWQQFSDAIIRAVALRKDPVIFLLWGKNAQQKCMNVNELIENRHIILIAAHPSPLSAYNGFYGCKHFSKTNAILQSLNKSPIDWQI